MRKWIRDHSLGIVAAALFLLTLAGQTLAGWKAHGQEQADHGGAPSSLVSYLGEGHFLEALFENWESEFLQMAMFVFLTAFLVYRGAADSRDPDGKEEPVDEDPRKHRNDPDAPWPVRHGGLPLVLYERSLGIVLFLLFLASFAGHAVTGAMDFNQEQAEHGGQPVSTLEYLAEPRFWYESFQNWQSEFLSVWALVFLSVFLRQRGSPESKPVHAPHWKTGNE